MSFSELSEYSYSLLVKGTPLTAAKKSPPLSLSAINSAASTTMFIGSVPSGLFKLIRRQHLQEKLNLCHETMSTLI